MISVEVRSASAADSAAISDISSEELGYSCEAGLVQAKLTRLDVTREAVFVALVDGQPAGYVHVERYELLYSETMANILGLAVKSCFQHIGVGRALISAAEKWATDNGIQIMRLNSGEERTWAHDFYRRMGYTSEKKQLRFIKKL
ncbi:MAG: GNAT family N-acetyltransferase [Oscillospiraceae bacterium]